MITSEILESFKSEVCPICSGYKQTKASFCAPCYGMLPTELRRGLFKKFLEGYEAAFEAAVAFIEEKRRSPANEYHESVMKICRLRLGLKEEDTRYDFQIRNETPRYVLKQVIAWNLGHTSWLETIESWLASVGYEIRRKGDAE